MATYMVHMVKNILLANSPTLKYRIKEHACLLIFNLPHMLALILPCSFINFWNCYTVNKTYYYMVKCTFHLKQCKLQIQSPNCCLLSSFLILFPLLDSQKNPPCSFIPSCLMISFQKNSHPARLKFGKSHKTLKQSPT